MRHVRMRPDSRKIDTRAAKRDKLARCVQTWDILLAFPPGEEAEEDLFFSFHGFEVRGLRIGKDYEWLVRQEKCSWRVESKSVTVCSTDLASPRSLLTVRTKRMSHAGILQRKPLNTVGCCDTQNKRSWETITRYEKNYFPLCFTCNTTSVNKNKMSGVN